VVDNGSTDSTADTVREFHDDPRIRYVHEPVAGLSRARNTGWQNALGRYVGYIDDDAVAADTWVSSVLAVFHGLSPKASWVGGPIELEWEVPGPVWIDEELRVPLGYVNWGQIPRRLLKQERLGGGNSVYPKQVLQDLGGFDERLGRGKDNLLSGEETQFQKKVEENGGFLYYHPGVKIYHWVGRERIRPSWFYRRYYWGGITDYFMAQSMIGNELSATENNPATGGSKEGKRWQRLMASLAQSTGIIASPEKTIQSRVYLSYVFGYLAGMFRWKIGKR
jgi:glycosyltransferase involved in cell wall biosynthesis